MCPRIQTRYVYNFFGHVYSKCYKRFGVVQPLIESDIEFYRFFRKLKINKIGLKKLLKPIKNRVLSTICTKNAVI